MSAIPHDLEERCGSNTAQNSMACAVFHRTIRSVPFSTVQRFLARTSRHPLDVRPHPLTPYVLTPFERTSTELMPYVQRIFNRRIWCFVPFGCHFFTLWESCIIGCGQPRLVLSHSQGVSECQNESKICKSVTKNRGKGVLPLPWEPSYLFLWHLRKALCMMLYVAYDAMS